MNVFVTGATGVLGRPVLRLLHGHGHTVKALCRSAANRELVADLGATPVDGSLFDADGLRAALEGCEAVLHLATRIPALDEMKRREAWRQNDLIRRVGTKNLVQAAMAHEDLHTIIYPSVPFFYRGAGARWIDATTAELDVAEFLRSTLDAEGQVAEYAASAPERRGIVLRFGAFYGPSSPDSKNALSMARKGLALPLADTCAYRSMIWIDDAASAVLSALDRCPSGIFDVTENEPFTQAQAIEALARAAGRRKLWKLPRAMLRLALPAAIREVMGRSQRISNQRFRDATGWRPAVPNQRIGWEMNGCTWSF